MNRLTSLAASVAMAALLGGLAQASEADAARLGADLTPNGAEMAGNADGTIPAYDGGLKDLGDHVSGGPYSDPYANDQILFTIDQSNVAQYADKLTDGQKAMIAAFPTYKINVYPTRRSCGLPDKAAEWNKKNAVTGTLTSGGNGVAGAFYAAPFPVPESGLEVLWNHLLRYRGYKIARDYYGAVVYPGRAPGRVRIQDEVIFRWSDPARSDIAELENKSIYFLQQILEPVRQAGTSLLVHETIDQVAMPRQVWTYNPGQRRVRRAPDVQYDNPSSASEGLTTSDMLSMFNGAPDRYEWTLVGKSEKFIPYNSYKMASPDTKIATLTTPNHLNPDPLRYELHRVWTVEGKLKADTRHIYSRRTFHLDEDSWMIVGGELYDARGELWRVQEAHMINYYDTSICAEVGTVAYDLQTKAYFVDALGNETKTIRSDVTTTEDRFNPNNLRQLGVR